MQRVPLVVVLLLFSIPAAAQEPGKVGVAMGFPGSIGIIWHLTDTVAVRPDFSFARTSSESESSTLKSHSWNLGTGVSALFYVGKLRENVRTYVSPRFAYSRTHTGSEPREVVLNSGTNGNSYQYAGSFGVQYAPSSGFSVYGEAGIAYVRSDSTFTSTVISGVVTGKSTNSTFGTCAGVGVVLYCN
jgi:opacity protein-like surface antigen